MAKNRTMQAKNALVKKYISAQIAENSAIDMIMRPSKATQELKQYEIKDLYAEPDSGKKLFRNRNIKGRTPSVSRHATGFSFSYELNREHYLSTKGITYHNPLAIKSMA